VTDNLTDGDLIAVIESAPAGPVIDIDPDGWLFDVHSGEIVGRVELDERFQVETMEAAEWALELRSRIEGDVAGIDERIRAVTAQLRLLRGERLRRLSWWDWRIAPSLILYARELLRGKKTKTARFGWGQVSFRSTKGSHAILDMEAAVAYVRTWAPGRVKVKTEESVGIRDVLEVRDMVARMTGDEPEHLPWFAASGPSENVVISTGIEIKNEKGEVP
jgi:hypothetical protein